MTVVEPHIRPDHLTPDLHPPNMRPVSRPGGPIEDKAICVRHAVHAGGRQRLKLRRTRPRPSHSRARQLRRGRAQALGRRLRLQRVTGHVCERAVDAVSHPPQCSARANAATCAAAHRLHPSVADCGSRRLRTQNVLEPLDRQAIARGYGH